MHNGKPAAAGIIAVALLAQDQMHLGAAWHLRLSTHVIALALLPYRSAGNKGQPCRFLARGLSPDKQDGRLCSLAKTSNAYDALTHYCYRNS